MAGYLLGSSWPLVMEWVGRYEKIVLLLTLVAIVVFVSVRLRQLLQARTDTNLD
jgi:hypothetical protein